MLVESAPRSLNPVLCIEFVNSRFTDHTGTDEVYDDLESPAWFLPFASRCGVSIKRPPTPAQRRELVQLRELTRDLLESGRDPGAAEIGAINRYLDRSPYVWGLSGRGGALRLRSAPRSGGWTAVMAAVAVSYCDLLLGGRIGRVRRCANPDCSWLFLDESRNASRRWCDPATCGNLHAVRRHRNTHGPARSIS